MIFKNIGDLLLKLLRIRKIRCEILDNRLETIDVREGIRGLK
jgi:hypothetical protein